MGGPTFAQLLAALPDDPEPAWPVLPDRPVAPGPGWAVRTTAAAGHPVWTRTDQPDDLAGAWLERREAYERTGLWPLLITEGFWEAVEIPEPPGHLRPGWTTRVLLGALVEGVESEPGYGPARGPLPSVAAWARRWGADVVADLASALGEPTELVLVPSRAPWLVPGLVGWDGAVNHDVLGTEHTAVLGRWHGLFGAEVVGLSRDVAALAVARPPTTAEARLSAAAEVYAYCPDSVDQGVGTLEALVEMTAGQEWVLWWD